MQSRIAAAIHSKYPPVALVHTNEKPTGAAQFRQGGWGCVVWLLAGAFKGRTAVIDERTYGCLGGGTGLGFGNCYEKWPGGIGCFYDFLSTGSERWAHQAADGVVMSRRSQQYMVHGEGYVRTPELVERFVSALPIVRIPTRYVVFRPLDAVEPGSERPESIIFLVNPDQLSALVVLANYGRGDNENVCVPFGAGCQTIGIITYREARRQPPRAVIGLTDLSVRDHIHRQFGREMLGFSVPFEMFLEMEGNVEGSFLQRDTWKKLGSVDQS
jgi:hypothetical protein